MSEEDQAWLNFIISVELMKAYTKGLADGFKMGRQYVLAEMGVKEQ